MNLTCLSLFFMISQWFNSIEMRSFLYFSTHWRASFIFLKVKESLFFNNLQNQFICINNSSTLHTLNRFLVSRISSSTENLGRDQLSLESDNQNDPFHHLWHYICRRLSSDRTWYQLFFWDRIKIWVTRFSTKGWRLFDENFNQFKTTENTVFHQNKDSALI